MLPPPPTSTLFPYTTLFRSQRCAYASEKFRRAERFRDVVVGSGDYITKRSEEHTSELQSRGHLVCRLLLEKKNDSDSGPNRLQNFPIISTATYSASGLTVGG